MSSNDDGPDLSESCGGSGSKRGWAPPRPGEDDEGTRDELAVIVADTLVIHPATPSCAQMRPRDPKFLASSHHRKCLGALDFHLDSSLGGRVNLDIFRITQISSTVRARDLGRQAEVQEWGSL